MRMRRELKAIFSPVVQCLSKQPLTWQKPLPSGPSDAGVGGAQWAEPESQNLLGQ